MIVTITDEQRIVVIDENTDRTVERSKIRSESSVPIAGNIDTSLIPGGAWRYIQCPNPNRRNCKEKQWEDTLSMRSRTKDFTGNGGHGRRGRRTCGGRC